MCQEFSNSLTHPIQFSLLAFMVILKQKELAGLTGIMLPITVFVKLAGTRLVKFRFDR